MNFSNILSELSNIMIIESVAANGHTQNFLYQIQ